MLRVVSLALNAGIFPEHIPNVRMAYDEYLRYTSNLEIHDTYTCICKFSQLI
jgi:hypothetical protein